MSQRQQLERILEIDRQIRAGRYPSAHSLASELEVSVRTIYDDRTFMLDRLRAPLEHDAERGGWFYSDPAFVLPTIFVNEGELLAFFLGVEVAQRYLGTDFEAPLKSAIGKLAASLGNQALVSLEQLREHYTFAAPASPYVNAELLVQLHQSIQARSQVRIRYYTASRDEWSERTVNPHHLYNTRGDWYLFAYDQLRAEMRNFHLGRVAWWQVLAEGFERVPNFSPDEWMRTAFQSERGAEPQDVVIRFDSYQARWVRERRWHQTQQPLEELADGGVVLRFRAGGLGEVKRWVLQYSHHAEVLEPEALRRTMKQELQEALRMYGGSAD